MLCLVASPSCANSHAHAPPAAAPPSAVQLFSRNADVDRVNAGELARLPGATVQCDALDEVRRRRAGMCWCLAQATKVFHLCEVQLPTGPTSAGHAAGRRAHQQRAGAADARGARAVSSQASLPAAPATRLPPSPAPAPPALHAPACEPNPPPTPLLPLSPTRSDTQRLWGSEFFRDCMAAKQASLKVGAQVMLVKNLELGGARMLVRVCVCVRGHSGEGG